MSQKLMGMKSQKKCLSVVELISCEIELDLRWSKYPVISPVSRTFTAVDSNPVEYEVITAANDATFQINNAKIYVPAFTLTIDDNINFLENTEQGFRTKNSWNKYSSEITTQSQNNTLDYLIDSTFRNVNRLSLLSFKNGNNDPFENWFWLVLREININQRLIRAFNALINY